MRIEDILRATGGGLIKGEAGSPVENFSIDSRTLKKKDLFIAIKGNRFDGHDFIEEAIRKGAIGAIISDDLQLTTYNLQLLIKVKDTKKALGVIAHYKRKQSRATVIAITGSNGKTTTKDMITSILKTSHKVLSARGTENNNIGLPLTLLRLKDEQFCVLEMGMNHFGEIDYLASIARPDIGVITNIGPCHLEHLGGIDDVFKAKTELIKYMDEGRTLIINGDDAHLSKIDKPRLRIIRFGLEKHNDIRATSVTFGEGGCPPSPKKNLRGRYASADIRRRLSTMNSPIHEGGWNFYVNDKYNVQLNLLGRHNIYNALAAVSVAELFRVEGKTIQEALKNFKPACNRLELKEINGIKVIDDTYNSNPASLRYAVEVLTGYEISGKKILVSGDMLELGKMSQYFHEAIVDILKNSGIDVLITVGRYSYKTYLAAKKGMGRNNLWHFDRADEAGRFLRDIAKEGDLVLIKGSRAMKMEDAIKCFITFSTR